MTKHNEQDFFDKLTGRITEADAENINFGSMEIDDVFMRDYPDFCDAYCSCVLWRNGTKLSEEELDDFNDVFQDDINVFIHENAMYI